MSNALIHYRFRYAGKVNTSLVAPPAASVTAISTATSTSGGGVQSLTYSHTINSGDNRVLVVGVTASQSNSVNYVKWGGSGGTSLTRFGYIGGDGSYARTEIYYLIAPEIGTKDVYVYMNQSNAYCASGAQAYSGVNQTTPLSGLQTNTGANATALTITSATTNIVFAALGYWDNSNTATGNQTTLWGVSIDGSWKSHGDSKAGAASTAISWGGSYNTTYASCIGCSIDVA